MLCSSDLQIMNKRGSNMKGKRIIITGASRGLGQICAEAFDAEGAQLVLMARSGEDLEKVKSSCTNQDKHLCIPVDLLDMEELNRGMEQALGFLDEVDVILHAAGGGLGLRDSLIKPEDLLKLFNLNVAAPAEINRLVSPAMVARGHGNLVHVGSIASTEATGSVGYNTAKAALSAYVRSLGNELIESGVIVTGILPGGFYAPGNAMQRLEKNKPEIYEQFIRERLPRKRMGMAEELVPLIRLLCSDDASMMGGCMVPIDAGEGKAFLQG